MIKCTFDGSFEFNKVHGFHGLHSIYPLDFYEDKGKTLEGTRYWLFIDMPEEIEKRKNEVELARKQGIKIVSLFYDEARFAIVDKLIEEGLVDKLILFDQQYENRFSIDTFVSDYYVEDSMFPELNKDRNGKMCYFGHKSFERSLPKKCKHISSHTLKGLYEIASIHSKGYVASTGRGEGGNIIYHNKAKYIEMLFCGLDVECQKGINTINYEQYKNREITEVEFEEIHKINTRVRCEILNQIKKL